MKNQILIVDDEAAICSLLMREFASTGYSSEFTYDPLEALERLEREPYQLIITDINMPEIDGLEFLGRAKKIRPDCAVIMMTGHASVDTIREALTNGAVDYLTKPFSISGELRPLVEELLADSETEEDESLESKDRSGSSKGEGFENIVASGARMSEVFDRARRVAASDIPVLLRGESGTGKEVVANFIHRNSPRRDQPFVKVNCAALPESLIESEFFGYAKGAFTGANKSRIGLFEVANGGTLLLDEVGEVSPSFQAKLLRVVQEGEFHRVGDSTNPVRVDVRIISATNRDLEEAVRAGTFRDDLFYRLNVVPIEIPPLREHIEDLAPLLDHYCSLLGKGSDFRITDEARQLLAGYPWPGNIREVVNAVKFATVMSDGPDVEIDDLPESIRDYCLMRSTTMATQAAEGPDSTLTLEQQQRESILQAMVARDFNRTQAAALLGVTRRALGLRIVKYGLEEEIGTLQAERRDTPCTPIAETREERPPLKLVQRAS